MKRFIAILTTVIFVLTLTFVPSNLDSSFAASHGNSIPYYGSKSGNTVWIDNTWGPDVIGNCIKKPLGSDHAEMAITCLSMANAAEIRQDLVEGIAVDTLGFNAAPWSVNYEKSFLDNFVANEPAVTFAFKKEKINGVTRNVYLVVVRGTTDVADTMTDAYSFLYDEGFQTAADNAVEHLEQFMSACRGKSISKIKKEKAKNVFIITGHSLGASVANLVAKDVINNKYANPKNTLAFTFAAPRTAKSSNRSKYCRIFNFINKEDIVPNLTRKATWKGVNIQWSRDQFYPEIDNEFHNINGLDLVEEMNTILPLEKIKNAHACDTYMAHLLSVRAQYDYGAYRLIGAEMTTGGGPVGLDFPTKTKINDRFVWLDYEEAQSLFFSLSKNGDAYWLDGEDENIFGGIVSNGRTFYFDVSNWKDGKVRIYKRYTYGEREKIYSTKKDVQVVGYYNGYLYVNQYGKSYYKNDQDYIKCNLRRIKVKTGKISTVKKGYRATSSYDNHFVLEKVGDGFINGLNTRYIYDAETKKTNRLPVEYATSYATPTGIINYEYETIYQENEPTISICDYDGQNKKIVLSGFYCALWLSDDEAGFVRNEKEYDKGITYILNTSTGEQKQGNGLWEDE
ncbi:MAG: hypothetical protein IJI74_05850 [Firmicutes bacterium]|nr:hypothetical protein [Bacillota bacterium]